MYVVAFLDRANIAFAKTALQTHLGISARSYAFGAGFFFVGYALCEIPSNLILYKVGAKPWMSRIMVSWGIVCAVTIFTRSSHIFYLLRFLLGAAEAGFFPGIILYLTYWFPGYTRGRILGLFYLGAPLAFIFGGPISSFLVHMSRFGVLQGWQWMFLVEGALAIAVGIWSYWYLDSRPEDAGWLSDEERGALVQEIARENHRRHLSRDANIFSLLRDRRVVHFSLIYLLIQISIYGVVFYLPTEVAALFQARGGTPVSSFTGSLASAIPWVCALVATLWLPSVADRTGRHRSLAALTLLVSGCANFLLPEFKVEAGLVTLSIAAAGFIAVQPLFWTMSADYLSGRAAAAGFALINAIGNFGGFFAPTLKVWAESYFHSGLAGIYLLAVLTIVGAILIGALKRLPERGLQSHGKRDAGQGEG